MKYLLVLVLGLVGCTNQKCEETLGGAASFISEKIATSLDCKKPLEIRADLLDMCAKLGVCEKAKGMTPVQAKGAVGDALCPALAKGMVALLVGTALPAKYECAGGTSADALAKIVETACKQYAPI